METQSRCNATSRSVGVDLDRAWAQGFELELQEAHVVALQGDPLRSNMREEDSV